MTDAKQKKISDSETIETLEATGEFDHGTSDFDGLYGTPGKEQLHMPDIKPKEMFLKAEHAVEDAIKSVLTQAGSTKFGSSTDTSKSTERVEEHTE